MPPPNSLTARVRRRLSPLRARIRASRAPGPTAPPLVVRRARLRHVVVIAYGRSGSTLVQGLLNTLPRTLVRGENGLYVLPLFRAHDSAVRFRELHMKHKTFVSHSAFYGLHEVRPRSFIRSARALVLDHLLGDVSPEDVDVIGFKEVAWSRLRPAEQAAFFDYLDQVLPGCRYVLNERDLDDVVVSGFWQTRDRTVALNRIRRIQEIQQFLRETRPERTVDVRYEVLTSHDREESDAQLRALAQHVHGSCDAVLLARLRETMAVGHGPQPFGRSLGQGPAGPSPRPATAADLPAVEAVWHQAWHDAHVGHVPQALLDARDPAYFTTWAAGLLTGTILAEEGGQVVGLVIVRDDEVHQLMLAPAARGTGAAAALLAAAEQRIAGAGHDRAWLAVVPGNARARRFYERSGWVDAGPETYAAVTIGGTVPVAVRRYIRTL